ncbi:MAG: uroporphyrinogen decarboxylase family protein [Eubacteriales bacterium]
MGKNLIFDVLDHKEMKEVPWVPFAGVHAGKLKGYTAKEILTDEDKLVESLLEVKKLYNPDGMPIVFDLQIEAEILGCDLLWAEDNPPSVSSHPYGSEKIVPCNCKIPTKEDGRIPEILSAMGRVKKEIGDDTALYGLICGPLTLASHLRGSEFFMDMITDQEYVKNLVEFCAEVAMKMSEYYIEAGMDVIAVVDPLVSQVSPSHFEEMLSDSFTAVFDYIRNAGAYSSFFVCGNATVQLDVMCKTNPDSISVDENVDLVEAKKVTDKYNIAVGGNIPLTTTMLHGNQQDNMKYVVDLIDSIEDKKNLIIAPGCDMPYDVPVENTIAVTQAVKQTDDVRKMVENYTSSAEDVDVELPDYDNLEKPLIEVFTLDAETCAACTYMLKAAQEAEKEYGEGVEVVEYKYTVLEDIARTKKMGVQKLPSIYINGELKWSSIIPSRDELFKEVKKVM